MEAEESKISVWVCREEKLVSGLSKRTTCADVIRVLLEEQNLQQCVSTAMLSGSPLSYCIVEKWRGIERILPNKTKILRLWSAWGEEQENVRFVLVKNEASLPSNGPRSAEARVVLSKESPCVYKGTARVTMALSQEKQRRIVRKAFRKLDKINKKRAQTVSKDASSLEKMETLVHLVISQDHTIRQQIQRIQELDREIDRYEAKVHLDRMKMHGINYVQDTYLVDANPVQTSLGEGDKMSSAEALAQFEEYSQRCEEVIKLQDELAEHEALMESITTEIQEELNQRWMKRRHEELSNKDCETSSGEGPLRVTSMIQDNDAGPPKVDVSSENDLLLEEERIRTQLDTSLYIGLRLNTDLEAIRSDLDLTKEIWGAKEKELMDLLEKVNSLDFKEDCEDTDDQKEADTIETDTLMPLKGNSVWVEQARGLSKTCNTNDDDSDTGLSSMHSQDSDITPVCESLV
ncbi:ras association domain-containing protein 10-like [Myxocyprinus asiaticus]|uniref:ras association domain-containing protein 10-like n=1 Tax=Myxocyprinus asiaticus TaxID=70543 RepID=UPI0022237244|nr:ras association domain-containing protein 10-like [Myxocyprinus asiaticus]